MESKKKNAKKSMKKGNNTFESLNNNKALMWIVGIIAIIALVFIGYGIFKPKEKMTVEEKKINVSGFPSNIGQVYEGTLVNYASPWFHHKYTKSYSVFCTDFRKTTPAANGQSCKLITNSSQWDETTQAAIGAIVKKSTEGVNGLMNNSSSVHMKRYYYGELAINEYLYKYTKNANSNTGTASNSIVKTLVTMGEQGAANAKQAFKMSLSPAKPTMSVDSKGNYISNYITVNGIGSNKYSVKITGVSGATVCNQSGTKFKVCVPASKVGVNKKLNISIAVSSSKSYPVAAKYSCGDSSYQTVTPSLVVNRTKSTSATATTTIVRPGIRIRKVDKATGKYVSGAKLVLTGPNNYKKEITTSTKEIVIGTDKPLANGQYKLQETSAPSGYILNNTVYTVTLSASNLYPIIKVENTNTGIVVSKRSVNVDGEIPGATLRIVDEKGNVKYGPWTTTTAKKVVTGLSSGTYYLEETKAPAGYKKSNVRIKFTIGSDGTLTTGAGKADELVFTNEQIKATFSKTDVANSKELPGAELQILDKDGKSLYKWISSSTPHVISMISAGKYFLVETQEPKGYVKKTEKIAFEIDEYGNITVGGKNVDKVVMTNEKTKVKISKQDVTNGKEIPGAQLQVKDANGKVVDKWTSTNKPHMIEGLSTGKYYLTERVAPNGYVVSEEKIEFIIKNDGTVDTVVMLNTPIVNVPNTASTASIIASIIGLVAVVFGGWMIFINVKAKKAR